jgi:hypothetical protein
MISSSVGICDRGDGIAPGGRGRQRACMFGVDGAGSDVACGTLEEDGVLLIGVCNPLAESLGGNMAEECQGKEYGPLSLRLTRKQLPKTPLVFCFDTRQCSLQSAVTSAFHTQHLYGILEYLLPTNSTIFYKRIQLFC